jgi:hypothetical protein
MNLLLAWRPFLDPLPDIEAFWYVFLLPLSFFLAMAYKGVRLTEFTPALYWREVVRMTLQVTLAIAALGLLTMLLVMVAVPLLSPR